MMWGISVGGVVPVCVGYIYIPAMKRSWLPHSPHPSLPATLLHSDLYLHVRMADHTLKQNVNTLWEMQCIPKLISIRRRYQQPITMQLALPNKCVTTIAIIMHTLPDHIRALLPNTPNWLIIVRQCYERTNNFYFLYLPSNGPLL